MVRLLLTALLGLGLLCTHAVAQTLQPKIFVASTGNDINDGSRASPKRSFQAAHDAVAAGGEIVVLDTAGYGPVVIDKAISIVAPSGVTAFVTVTDASTTGIRVGPVSGVVVLRGLIVEGPGSTGGGTGISRDAGYGTLVIEDTTVRNFGQGIAVVDGTLVVRRGAVRNTSTGISVSGDATGGTINALVTETELTGNNTAILVFIPNYKNSNLAALVATRCSITGSQTAFRLLGVYPQVVLDGCTISGNNSVFYTDGDGVFYTRSNNTIYNNTSLGATTTPFPSQ